MRFIFILFFTIFFSMPSFLHALEQDEIARNRDLKRIIDVGDFYFREKDYKNAFNYYKKAMEINNSLPLIHYRLGNAYSYINPGKDYSENEYAIALYLFLKEHPDLKNVDVESIKKALEIPSDTPIRFMRRDIDKDKKDTIFLLMKRGFRSYVLFAIDIDEFHPKISHLVTYYKGDNGTDDIDFKDLDEDGKEEIIIVCNMKDFLNLVVIRKNNDKYETILNHMGAFKGKFLISKSKATGLKDIEVFENLREGVAFSENTGPFLIKKTLYVLEKGVYRELQSDVLKDEGFYLNEFFKALMVEGNFQKAYDVIDPNLFLEDAVKDDKFSEFVEYMKNDKYNALLAEKGANTFFGKVLVKENVMITADEGWEDLSPNKDRMPRIKSFVKNYKVYLGPNVYQVIMRKSGIWKVTRLVRLDATNEAGWSE